jgi:predicted amidohydrolase YtcJ
LTQKHSQTSQSKFKLQVFLLVILILSVSGCALRLPQYGTVIYPAKTIVTMTQDLPIAEAVTVKDGDIIAVGSLAALSQQFPNARIDDTFQDKVIVPGLIDPHIHMLLGSIQYALPFAPPWDIPTAKGIVKGQPNRQAFFNRVREIVNAEKSKNKPIAIWGFHNLIHGHLTRHDLDKIAPDRPLLIWHYSVHDFFLNSAALAQLDMSDEEIPDFVGIERDSSGELTGRIYEDALRLVYDAFRPSIASVWEIRRGQHEFSKLLNQNGVTSVAELGYGVSNLSVENWHLRLNYVSPQYSGYRLFLVPEHRGFKRKYGDRRIEKIKKMIDGKGWIAGRVLPQVKFFADAAFYSQTMRLGNGGYLSGQSKGTKGVWVLPPDQFVEQMEPYWDEGLGIRIHSNGDAAQTVTLNALKRLREKREDGRFVVEHGGLFSPTHIEMAGELGAVVSAASHYVYHLGEAFRGPLGKKRARWISPLASLGNAGVPVTLHSDAPLAPPDPLLAASMHLTRETREGNVFNPKERLSKYEAMESITVDAAYALGLENEIGRIKAGMRADFTILDKNPLETEGRDWDKIGIWGVVLDGRKRANH